jgi:hypothetical protein
LSRERPADVKKRRERLEQRIRRSRPRFTHRCSWRIYSENTLKEETETDPALPHSPSDVPQAVTSVKVV